MTGLVVTVLIVIGIFLLALIAYQGMTRSCDLMSVRNMYLAGFIVYQLVSPAIALYTQNYTFFRLQTPEDDAVALLGYVVVYLLFFFISYHGIKLSSWFAGKMTKPRGEMSDSFLLAFAVSLIAIAAPLRVFGVFIPAIAAPSAQVAIAIAAVASAIAGWVWGNRRFNPAVWGIVAGIVLACIAVTLVGAYSRRPILSVVMGFAWGAYHRRFKFMSPGKLIINTVPVVLVAFIVVSAFTEMRHNRETAQSSVSTLANKMANADIKAGAADVMSGQTTGSATLWAIENYPLALERNPLFSLRYMAMWYVPRAIWPEKPAPLGNHVAALADVAGVHHDKITIPPGVLGYAAAEGGIIAVIVYALFYGQFLRFFDQLARLNPTTAMILLPIGCATGQMLGLARGCIAIFANLMVLGFVSSYLLLSLSNRFFARPVAPQPMWYPQHRY